MQNIVLFIFDWMWWQMSAWLPNWLHVECTQQQLEIRAQIGLDFAGVELELAGIFSLLHNCLLSTVWIAGLRLGCGL